MKITFANWGNYTIAFKTLFRGLGIDFVPSERTSPKSIQEGAKLSPEMYCFPLKVNIGNYLSGLEKGADTILMWENIGGSCRQRYYGDVQQKVLRDAGYKVRVINLSSKNILSTIRELRGENRPSWWKIIKTLKLAFKQLRFIQKLEKKATYLRPREERKGETDQILTQTLEKLGSGFPTLNQCSRLEKETRQKISKLKIDKNKDVPRVGLIGEIYTVSDSAVNFDLEKKLGREGIEVHREMDILYQIKKMIFFWTDWRIQRKINPYLKSTVGGHGRDAIYEMLDYIKKDSDGIIHLLPFGCMPETTIRPILEKIHLESGVPFLSLSLDEQVAEAGINTRIEAFVDVVNNYHQIKNI